MIDCDLGDDSLEAEESMLIDMGQLSEEEFEELIRIDSDARGSLTHKLSCTYRINKKLQRVAELNHQFNWATTRDYLKFIQQFERELSQIHASRESLIHLSHAFAHKDRKGEHKVGLSLDSDQVQQAPRTALSSIQAQLNQFFSDDTPQEKPKKKKKKRKKKSNEGEPRKSDLQLYEPRLDEEWLQLLQAELQGRRK